MQGNQRLWTIVHAPKAGTAGIAIQRDDSRRVFMRDPLADGLNIPIGLLPYPSGREAIVHNIPNIYRMRDTDGDGRADTRQVLYGVIGHRDTHGMTNAFTWGFDGWIYACHGFANDSRVA